MADNIQNAIGGLGTLFGEIADAIRTKDGSTGSITPLNFPQRILLIPTEGTDNECQVEIQDIIKNEFTLKSDVLISDVWYDYECLSQSLVGLLFDLPEELVLNHAYFKYDSVKNSFYYTSVDNLNVTNLNNLGCKADQDNSLMFIYPNASNAFTWLNIQGYIVNDGETHKWTIPDNDATNAHLSQLTTPLMVVTHELVADANINYALDHILGISDTKNSDRTFNNFTIALDENNAIVWANSTISQETPKIYYNVLINKNKSTAPNELVETVEYTFDPEDLIPPEEGLDPLPIAMSSLPITTTMQLESYENIYIRVEATADRYNNKLSTNVISLVDLPKFNIADADLITFDYDAETDYLTFHVPEGSYGELWGGQTQNDKSLMYNITDGISFDCAEMAAVFSDYCYFDIITKQRDKLYRLIYQPALNNLFKNTEFSYALTYTGVYSGSIYTGTSGDSKTVYTKSYSSYGYQTGIYRCSFSTGLRSRKIKVTISFNVKGSSGYYASAGISKLDYAFSRSTNSGGSWSDSASGTAAYLQSTTGETTYTDTQELIYECEPGDHFIDVKVQRGYYGYAYAAIKVEQL